jgi:predicted lactoylglutathione lyase
MPFALPAAVPQLPVADLTAACAYYQRYLGFTLDWSDATSGIAGVSHDACRIFLAGPDFPPVSAPGPLCIWLNLASTAEVDDLYRDWHDRGATLTSAPTLQPWNLYEFSAADLDGNVLRVFFDMG